MTNTLLLIWQEGSFNFNDTHYTIVPVDKESPELSYERLDGVPHLVKKAQLPKGIDR